MIMEEGWIKIYRKIVEWEWYKTPGMVQLWLHLLVTANWEDKKLEGEIVHRGSLVTGRKKLSEETGLSEQQVRTCLHRLEKTQNLTINSTKRGSVITICDYDDYQALSCDEQPSVQPTINQQSTNNQPLLKNIRIKEYNTGNNNAPAYTREDWRYISSVRRSTLNNDPDRIADHKRSLFRAEVNSLANELGMTSQQVEAFCRYWSESSPRSERIKADFEITFDTRSRMQNWIERDRPRITTTRPAEKSRMDQFKENMEYIDRYFYGQQQQQDSTADEQ